MPYHFCYQKWPINCGQERQENIFNGRILEIEGLEDLTVEQAYELTDASAERSAAAAVISLSEDRVIE